MLVTHRPLALAAAALIAVSTACGTDTSSTTTPVASDAGPRATAAPVTLSDGWAKSTDSMSSAMGSMTGVFGTLHNSGSEPVTITGGSSPAGRMVQLHETVRTQAGTMQMQEANGGFTIPAGGSLRLEPGADHIMVMDLTEELKVGGELTIELTTSAGPATVTAAVRAFPGADESYSPAASSSPSMSH